MRHEILRSAVNELVRVGLVVLPNGSTSSCGRVRQAQRLITDDCTNDDMEASSQLYQLASICDGLSGRSVQATLHCT